MAISNTDLSPHSRLLSPRRPRINAYAIRVPLAARWALVLIICICFEGLGRKWLPWIPSLAFYFAKDVVLMIGLLSFGIAPVVGNTAMALLGLGRYFVSAGLIVTFVEMFNPDLPTILLGFVGFRAYWLWWLAPLILASAVRTSEEQVWLLRVLAVIAIVVAVFGIYQFFLPADHDLNLYAMYDGKVVVDQAGIASTGRARVASTFSYITGYSDFLIMIPALLLALGLSAGDTITKALTLGACALCATAMPMSGSRGVLVLSSLMLLMVFWGAGAMSTVLGRRILVGALLAASVGALAVPDAVQGLVERFQMDDTTSRFEEAALYFPPYTIASVRHDIFGGGTGAQHNSRLVFGADSPWDVESESGRILVELGPVGYLIVCAARYALGLALLRIAPVLRGAGDGGAAGMAYALAFLCVVGGLVFDHIFQSLFMLCVGIIFISYLRVQGSTPEAAQAQQRG